MSTGIGKVILLLVALVLVLLTGQWAATNIVFAVGAQLAVIAFIVVLMLGRHVWLLIPFFYSFSGVIHVLPGSFSPRNLVVLFVVPVLAIIWIASRFKLKIQFRSLEFFLFIQFVMIGQAFMRNPVGLSSFGGDTVGGRDYFEMGVALMAFVILSIQVVSVRYAKIATWSLFSGGVISSLINALSGLIPGIGYRLAPFYSSMGAQSAIEGIQHGGEAPTTYEEVGRKKYMRALGETLFSWVMAKSRPLMLLGPSKWYLLIIGLFAVICGLYSGYRSVIVWFGLMTIVSAWIQKSFKDIVVLAAIGAPFLIVLLILQGSVIDLPMPAQRALSFLPADWDYMAVSHAQDSSDWRFEMWKEVLISDEYINNKFIGDGFGFSAQELAYQQAMLETHMTPELLQEYFMRIGKYHSGPIETVRRVGYLGLIVLLFGMWALFKEAKNTAREALDGQHRVETLFVCIPTMVIPIFFIFVAGSYTNAIVTMCFMAGMLRLLQNVEYPEEE